MSAPAAAARVIARGELVRVREKLPGDARSDYRWRTDRELAAYDAVPPLALPFRSWLASFTESLRRPSAYRRSFAIEELAGGRHIGNVMYYGYDAWLGEAELGITIGERDYWGRGYGSDAVRCLLSHLFGGLGLRRVYLHTLASNLRAQHAFRRAGFRRRRSVRRDGYDFERMEITREEFAAQRPRDALAGVATPSARSRARPGARPSAC